jgi:DNA-binding response OmpR family regulator
VQGGRILVVDDDVLVRETVGQVLAEEGYAVDYAEDGFAALRKVSADPPDAILLDLMMPGMNGRQFLTALREDLGRTDLPVLVMTAVHGIAAHRSLSLDASDVVEKPFDVEELLNKVALALFRAREGVPEAPHNADAEGSGPSFEPSNGVPNATPVPPPPTTIADGGVVLVIDDDRQSLRRLDALLSHLGYTVVWLSRFTADLPRLARVLEPRAVLIDLHLPEIGGLAVLRRLRAERALDDVPILMLGKNIDAIRPARAELTALAAVAAPAPLSDDVLVEFITAPPASARRILA